MSDFLAGFPILEISLTSMFLIAYFFVFMKNNTSLAEGIIVIMTIVLFLILSGGALL